MNERLWQAYRQLAGAVRSSAWEEVIAGRPSRWLGRDRRTETEAARVDWRSYLDAIRTLVGRRGRVWADIAGASEGGAKLQLAKVLAAKFGVERARELVAEALDGDGAAPPPAWWLENRRRKVVLHDEA